MSRVATGCGSSVVKERMLTSPTLWGSGEGLLPLRKNRPSVAPVEGKDKAHPALTTLLLGFDSQLVLGSPRVDVQQN